MFAQRRPRRIYGLSFNRMIPNILTMAALCAGLTAIRYGIDGKWHSAVAAVLIAGVLDGLDGRVARLLASSTKFGAELDSLSDFVSFGVAPAFVLYLWTMRTAGNIGWALTLLFAVCCALRLARFNTMLGDLDQPPPANFFTGVPAPAAAGLVLLPMMISFQDGASAFFASPALNSVMLIMVALLMVSRIPTFSGKRVRVQHAYVLPVLLCAGVLIVSLVTVFWGTMAFLGALYLISIPLSIRADRRIKARTATEPTVSETEGPQPDESKVFTE